MIKINGKKVVIEKFPDGTPRIKIDHFVGYEGSVEVTWFYESNDELMYLTFIKKHLERHIPNEFISLFLPYIPNARMDRTKGDDEVFTLKYFCDFINWLHFSTVSVIKKIGEEVILYFPDSGAAKRYSELFPDIQYCYGEKNRDWKTGKILGLTVRTNGIDLAGKNVLMADDIIAFGGSLHFGAAELKKRGAGRIYAYATHTENSVLDKEKGTLIKDLENNTVERLFTTNSLFSGKHEKITVMEV